MNDNNKSERMSFAKTAARAGLVWLCSVGTVMGSLSGCQLQGNASNGKSGGRSNSPFGYVVLDAVEVSQRAIRRNAGALHADPQRGLFPLADSPVELVTRSSLNIRRPVGQQHGAGAPQNCTGGCVYERPEGTFVVLALETAGQNARVGTHGAGAQPTLVFGEIDALAGSFSENDAPLIIRSTDHPLFSNLEAAHQLKQAVERGDISPRDLSMAANIDSPMVVGQVGDERFVAHYAPMSRGPSAPGVVGRGVSAGFGPDDSDHPVRRLLDAGLSDEADQMPPLEIMYRWEESGRRGPPMFPNSCNQDPVEAPVVKFSLLDGAFAGNPNAALAQAASSISQAIRSPEFSFLMQDSPDYQARHARAVQVLRATGVTVAGIVLLSLVLFNHVFFGGRLPGVPSFDPYGHPGFASNGAGPNGDISALIGVVADNLEPELPDMERDEVERVAAEVVDAYLQGA